MTTNLITIPQIIMRIFKYLLPFLFFVFLYSGKTEAQNTPQTTRILFVFDASQSMYARWENGSKMQIATRLLKDMVDSLEGVDNVQLALRVYGHQYSVVPGNRNCKDTKLEVPFGKTNHQKIRDKLSSLRPRGTTLIAYALEQAANDFPSCSNCRNIIILITDGIEECDGDPCAVSLALQKNGITLKPFVIGLGLEPEIIDAFRCVGNFYDAQDEETFKTVLGIVISQALNNTTAQVNLLDIMNRPTETNVAMTFYDSFTGAPRYNFIHTLDYKGNPDTIPIDPLGKYDLVVHTIPPKRKEGIELVPGIHNTIAVETPQGDLELKMNGFNEYKDLKAIVRQSNNMKTLNIQDFNKIERYIVGKYDLEILTLPRINIKGVNIEQSHTTTIQIPQPGIASIHTGAKGHGSIFKENGDILEWVCNLSKLSTRESIVLQPGNYRIVFRPINAKQSIYTEDQHFEIISGQSTTVEL